MDYMRSPRQRHAQESSRVNNNSKLLTSACNGISSTIHCALPVPVSIYKVDSHMLPKHIDKFAKLAFPYLPISDRRAASLGTQIPTLCAGLLNSAQPSSPTVISTPCIHPNAST